jgi:hypothetical protein
MHRGHDHDHHHHGGAGHNHPANVTQWQTPHLPNGAESRTDASEHDVDLVEDAFVDAFPRAPDPTSFLRLSGVPFLGETADGKRMNLLRVEISHTTDVGTLTPHVGGASHRYDPLPAKMTSRRQTLALAYFDGEAVLRLSLAEARALTDPTKR